MEMDEFGRAGTNRYMHGRNCTNKLQRICANTAERGYSQNTQNFRVTSNVFQ